MSFEITVRHESDIEKLAELIQQFQIKTINLTDKNGLIDNLYAAERLLEAIPDLEIRTHYSFKNHTSKYPEVIVENFLEYLESAQKVGVKEVLLVSGHPRPKFNIVPALNLLKERGFQTNLTIACGFNPYLSDSKLEEELERLEQKISSELISKVYIQIGSDIDKLRHGIDQLKSRTKDKAGLQISGCLLVPNMKFLNSFAFRPWHGVILSDEYLESLHTARKITSQIKEFYEQNNIEALIELIPFSSENLQEFGLQKSGLA